MQVLQIIFYRHELPLDSGQCIKVLSLMLLNLSGEIREDYIRALLLLEPEFNFKKSFTLVSDK